MNTSSKFPVKRRLDVSSDFISVSPKLRLLAKEIVDDFLSTKGEPSFVVPTSHVITTNVWNERCGLLQDDLSKQISSLKRQITVNGEHLQARRHALLRFVRLAGHNPSLTADLLYEGKGGVSNRRGYFIKKPKVTCCHATSGGQQCNEQALLYSKYCLEHITCDKQQVLYQSCSVADNDTLTKCNKPIVELLQDKPYCYKHVSSGKSEAKKTSMKLIPVTVQNTKRKLSPSRLKIKDIPLKQPVTPQTLTISTNNLSPLQTTPMLVQSLSSLLPSPVTSTITQSTWTTEHSKPKGGGGDHQSQLLSTGHVSEASERLTLSPPPLLPTLSIPPVLLLPPDPTPGCFLDDDSSSNEDMF